MIPASLLYAVNCVKQFLNFKMSIDNLCHALPLMTNNFLDDFIIHSGNSQH